MHTRPMSENCWSKYLLVLDPVCMYNNDVVKVEILRGGKNRPMKLPDANSVSLYHVTIRIQSLS